MDSISWQHSFDIVVFFVTRNVVAFESRSNFHFSTIYDLNTAKLQ